MAENPAPDAAQTPAPAAGRRAGAAADEPCRTRLLVDEPACDEEIIKADVPHRKLARAIAELMRHEPKGVSIGLEGSWGAGKTSVIRLLKKELERELVEPGRQADDDAGRVFALVVFDAWAHEKDPLRRTFLETLITRLRAIEWVRRDVWKKRHDIIAQRLEERRTQSNPHLSKAGLIAAILFLFLTPIGSALFSDAVKTTQFWPVDTSRPIAWRLVAGLLMMLMPALVLGVVYRRELWDVFARWIADPKRGTGWVALRLRRFKPAPREESPSLWAMLFNKGVTAEQTRTFKTPNPTSIEFEAEFRRLMEEALSGCERDDESETHDALWEDPPPTEECRRRHLVLVFDNLDRVAASDALTIWSTLQTFLGRADERRPAWSERLWVIVLYDPAGLRLIWDKPGATRARAEGQTAPAPTAQTAGPPPTAAPPPSVEARADNQPDAAAASAPTPGAAQTKPEAPPAAGAVAGAPSAAAQTAPDAAAVASTSFMDKSFQIRFEVPPPVFSDWRESLGKFLGDALDREVHTPEEFDSVQTVFELYLAETGQEPTFRELKLFVNQIGALHRQWADYCRPQNPEDAKQRFPLSCYAFYVLQRRRGVDVLGRLAEGTLIGENYRELLGENPTATLAALAYNVPRAKAEQIVLEKPIENALLVGAEGAESLAGLEARHEGFWDKLRLVLDPNRPGVNAQHRRSALWVGNAAQALRVSGILDREERHPLTGNIVRRLCRLAAGVEEWPVFDARKAEALAALCRWRRELGVRLDETDDGSTLDRKLLRSASASLAPAAGKVSTEVVKEWLGNVSTVRRAVEENQHPGPDGFKPINLILEPFDTALKPDERGAYKQFGHERLNLLLEALPLARGTSETPQEDDWKANDDLMQELVEGGHLLHHLWEKTHTESIEPDRIPAIVRCLSILLFSDPNLSEPPATGESLKGAAFRDDLLLQADSQVVAGFVELQGELDLWPLLEAYKSTVRKDWLAPFTSACLKQAIGDREHAHTLLGPEVLHAHWSSVYELVNGAERPLAQMLRDHIRRLPAEELRQQFSWFSLSLQPLAEQSVYGWLYAEAMGVPEILTIISEQVSAWEKALHEVDTVSWREEILNWGGLYELAFALRKAGRLSPVPAALKGALVEVAEQLVGMPKPATSERLKFSKLGSERSPAALLDRSSDAEVFEQIYTIISDSPESLSEPFFDVFGGALADPSHLAADGFERILVPLLRAKSEEGIRWMARTFNASAVLCESEVARKVKDEIERMVFEDDAFADGLPDGLIKLAVFVNVDVDLFRRYDVHLLQVGPHPEEVRATLRKFLAREADINMLIERAPYVIDMGMSFKRAYDLERLLNETGAKVERVVSESASTPVVSSEPSSPTTK